MNICFEDKRLGVSIKRERVEVNNMPRCHTHDRCELYFLAEGERYLYAGGRAFHVRAGDVFLIPPGLGHRTLDSGGGAYTKLTCMLPTSLLPEGTLPTDVYIVRPTGVLREQIHREAEIAATGGALDRYAAALKLLAAVLSIREHREQAESPALGRMSEIIDYIESRYTERITLTALSERFFISEYYLCRLFKEYTGSTIMSYVTGLRLDRARRLLERGGRVAEVARECGFGSVSAFSTAFGGAVGCSPVEYRKRTAVDRKEKI